MRRGAGITTAEGLKPRGDNEGLPQSGKNCLLPAVRVIVVILLYYMLLCKKQWIYLLKDVQKYT